MRIVVLCPHFAPDTAPTGTVMTRIVEELAARGHRVEVITALPWYRRHAIEPGWHGRLLRRERTPWGRITRLHPFPGSDKRNLLRRAAGFAGFSALAAAVGCWRSVRADAVIAMSPPLTMGLTGWIATGFGLGPPLIFNIQDVFPDAAVKTGALTNRRVIAAAGWLERVSYRAADAVTVLSDDLADNVRAKLPRRLAERVVVIPNFVDTGAIQVGERMTAYRAELGIADEPVVMYAGNVGFSQSLELLIAAAPRFPDVRFVINGAGSARAALESSAAGLSNVVFGEFQPEDRLGEVLATADLHVVPLRAGLGAVSVPSKTYSILAAGRPLLAAIDPDTEVTRMLEASGAGVAVPPDDQEAFDVALAGLLADRRGLAVRGAAGRRWIESALSPADVAARYEALIEALRR